MSLLSALLWFCGISSVFAAPEIRNFTPRAVVPGQRTVLTFSGRDLDATTNLWTSFGGKAVPTGKSDDRKLSFSVDCPLETSGIHAIQLSGSNGASNFQLIMIDALPAESHKETHREFDSPHRIIPPVAVDGILKSEQIDYYRFRAKAGKRYSIEVIAHRIGSEMDPVVRVLDAYGGEVAFCDDDGSVWRDARFEFPAPFENEYSLAIHDVGFGGGSAFHYRLRVTEEPLVWLTFPLSDPEEDSVAIEEIGTGLRNTAGGSPANPSPALRLSAAPQLPEAEPNDDQGSAQAAGVPMVLHGRIQNGSDTDFFRFDARKDQQLVFQSQTRSLGSPCDLVLRLRGEDGSILAESNPGSPLDAALTNKISETGLVYLEVRELSGTAITNAPYRIKAREFVPGFDLSSEENILNLKPGEKRKLKVNAVRYGYEGPIELRFDPPIPGVAMNEAVIPANKDEIELNLEAADDLAPGAFQHSKIIGTGTNAFAAKVSTKPALRKAFPLMLNPPVMLDGVFAVTGVER